MSKKLTKYLTNLIFCIKFMKIYFSHDKKMKKKIIYV